MNTVAVCIGATKRLLDSGEFGVCMVQEILTKTTSIFRIFFYHNQSLSSVPCSLAFI